MMNHPERTIHAGDRDDFLHLLEAFTVRPDCRIHFSETVQRGLPNASELRPDIRLDLVWSGMKHMRYPTRGGIAEVVLNPGDIHYCPPMTWKEPCWDRLHAMSSLIFTPQFIRITYIDYREISNYYEHHGAEIFYHTAGPLCEPGQAVLHALNLLGGRPDSRREAAPALFDALFAFTRETVKSDQVRLLSKREHTREQILQYLYQYFRSPISRESVAEHFSLNPRYISQLFHTGAGNGFNGTLRRLRLEYAAVLLQNTRLTVDEITFQCGYSSSTYFIAIFRQVFKMTPGEFRKRTGI